MYLSGTSCALHADMFSPQCDKLQGSQITSEEKYLRFGTTYRSS